MVNWAFVQPALSESPLYSLHPSNLVRWGRRPHRVIILQCGSDIVIKALTSRLRSFDVKQRWIKLARWWPFWAIVAMWSAKRSWESTMTPRSDTLLCTVRASVPVPRKWGQLSLAGLPILIVQHLWLDIVNCQVLDQSYKKSLNNFETKNYVTCYSSLGL